jgi:FHS family glucose/mannose:H+ symporter-like MFS transporter
VLPWLAARLDLLDSAAGTLFSAQFASGLAGGGLSGLLVGRVGEARTLASGFVLMSTGLLALAFGEYGVALAGACAAGAGMGLVIPTMNLLVASIYRNRAAAALGELNLAWGLGAGFWPLCVVFAGMYAQTGWALIALSAASAAKVTLVPATTPLVERGGVQATPSPQYVCAMRLMIFGALLLLYGGVEAALGGWLPEHARRLLAAAPTVPYAVAGTAFWGGLTSRRALVALFVSDSHEHAAGLAGLSLTLLAILLLLSTRDAVWIAVGSALSGLGLAPVFPVTVAALSREIPASVGGPLVALGGLGGATIPWLVGVVSDRAESLSSGLATLMVFTLTLLALHSFRTRVSGRVRAT